MSSLSAALLDTLDDADLDRLAERLAPHLLARVGSAGQDEGWIDVTAAADHLACPKSRVYALCSAHRLPHHKDGSRTLFKRSELDQWGGSGGACRP